MLSAPSVLSSARTFTATVRLLLCLLVLAACPVLARAQAQNTGTVSGTVADTTHSVIPAAAVTLTSEDRGNVYTTVSNGQGEYTFNDVPVGSYTLQVTSPGFSSFLSNHIALDSDTRQRVDASLRPGSEDTQVVVTADALVVNTSDATLSQIIDNDFVENLPIDGNNVVELAALLPGVTDVNAPTTFTNETGGATMVVNGARGSSNLFLFDGLLWNNLYLNTGINYPNHAVLNQVSVQLNNFSAQYGRSSGSIFNVVSKAGTNAIHGELFFHYHDTMFDASNYFSHTKPPQHTYQFGGSVGGPIIKDKLFYEAEYQSLIGWQALQANAETLTPNEEGLNADGTPFMCTNPALSGQQCASFAGDAKSPSLVQSLIVNPLFTSPSPTTFGTNTNAANSQLQSTWTALGNTGTSPCIATLKSLGAGYLTNAEIPAICFDPIVQQIIKRGYIPTPTTHLGSSQFLYSSVEQPQPAHEYGGFLRFDYNLNARQTMAFRFYRTENSDLTAINGASSATGVPSYEVDANQAFITAGSASHTYVLTQNIVNVATLGYKRYAYDVHPTDSTTLNSMGSQFSYPGFQSLPVINVSTRFTLGNSQNALTHSINENEELVDNLSWVKGRHNFQFGVDVLHLQYLNLRTNVGSFGFYGNPGFTNAQSADFIMGLVYTESVGNMQRISAIQNAIYSYAQDTWRIKPRLTLTLGVRYELPQPWYQPDGASATFIRGYQSSLIPNAPTGLAFSGDPGVPRSLIKTDFTNVSPRLGFAYDLFGNGKTAIRGGFGTFYDAIPATVVGLTQPYTYRATYNISSSSTCSNAVCGSLTNPLLGDNAIPNNYTPGQGTPTFTAPYSVIYPDANFRNSYTLGVNFGFQQKISKGGVLEVNYLGRFARHLMIPVDENPSVVDCSGPWFAANPALYCTNFVTTATPNPTYNYSGRATFPGFNYGGQGVVDLLSEATASYNALQLNYQQRAIHHLTLMANYTYSRNLDEQSNVSTSNATPQPQNIRSQYALSDQNSTQVLNMGWRLGLPKVRTRVRSANYAFSDWSFNGVYNARTGHPVNLTFGGDMLGTDEPNQRPQLLPGMSPMLDSGRHRTDKINEWFNTAAFAKPAAFTVGNVGRNSIIGPAFINTQFSLTKQLSFNKYRKGMHGEFRAEAFNVFNTINLGQPQAQLTTSAAQSSTFGSINYGASTSGTSPNRVVQFGLILYF